VAWRVLQEPVAHEAFPVMYFVGGLLLTMVCGEFSSLWRSRIRRLSQANAYLEDRIERVTNRLFMVQRSHDVLEQDLLLQPSTLRQALGDMRARSLAGQLDAPAAARAFLDFLGVHCQIESAQVINLAPGSAHGMTLASVGQVVPVDLDDALVRHALDHHRLAHVQAGFPVHEAHTDHLVAAPLVLGTHREPALLVVSHMPFLALHDEALELMAVLCSSFSDAALVGDDVPGLVAQLPDCPVEFAEEASRLDRLARQFRLPSQVIVLHFCDPVHAASQIRLAQRRARTPDIVWSGAVQDGCQRLVTLMPLVGQAAVDGYLHSMASYLAERQGLEPKQADLGSLGIRSRVVTLGQTPLATALRDALGEEGA
jgi:polysaccharide biosynthesis protein PelD